MDLCSKLIVVRKEDEESPAEQDADTGEVLQEGEINLVVEDVH